MPQVAPHLPSTHALHVVAAPVDLSQVVVPLQPLGVVQLDAQAVPYLPATHAAHDVVAPVDWLHVTAPLQLASLQLDKAAGNFSHLPATHALQLTAAPVLRSQVAVPPQPGIEQVLSHSAPQ